MVTLRLVGVRDREVGDRLVEPVAPAEVAADEGGLAGAGVRTREDASRRDRRTAS